MKIGIIGLVIVVATVVWTGGLFFIIGTEPSAPTVAKTFFVACALTIFLYLVGRWLYALYSIKHQQKLDNNPISKGNTKMNDDNGIAELIRQQEQTNEHLQKLISDFFWFRIAIAGILLVGFIFGSGVFK